ncbi:hypothetical protein PHLCEN_2v6700 [Hermanssonia centrifuga]|uniref:DNA2/NAM7 helicase helicase domain-containing protein n=1 Tax=Hermanssonia centrifuga TaxID=98765 RepID=A0A2R6NZA4_9APHY|nr:hypothetical protein PHLCEN_2v6700 [Hermanssonia centrifuga]
MVPGRAKIGTSPFSVGRKVVDLPGLTLTPPTQQSRPSGPPGTGKSYTGVELLRVLLANDAGPILMIAFTNCALDHMLCSVLDASITQKIVRLGSRSADERIAEFNSVETAIELAGKSRLDRAFAGHHWELKQVEEEFQTFKISVDTENILEYIEVALPIHFQDIIDPPEGLPPYEESR